MLSCRIFSTIEVLFLPLSSFLFALHRERVFDAGSSRVEVTFYTNILCLGVYTTLCLMSGDLQKAVIYATNDPYAAAILLVYTFLAYIAIMFHMSLVQVPF